jgi:DNA-binding XRE family transcriptional regulator
VCSADATLEGMDDDPLQILADVFTRTTVSEGAPGERVASARHDAGLTQQQFAAKVGINRVTLARIESGAATPTLGVALNIAARLDVTVESLFEEDVHHLARMLVNGTWQAIGVGREPFRKADLDRIGDHLYGGRWDEQRVAQALQVAEGRKA